MKHPALTRVMAVVLIIACAAMLISGALGLGEAQTKYNADIEEYDKLNERIATYKELTAKLDGEDSYKETIEKLDERQEQHDKDASDYRTDLAERTATQGGYKQGADALWEAKAELSTAELQYKYALEQFQAAEAEYNSKMSQLDALPAQAAALAQACAAASAIVPTPPGDPVAEPTMPNKPTEVKEPPQLGENPTEEERAAYENELAAYNEYKTITLPKYNSDMNQYNADKEKYDAYVARLTQYETDTATINTLLGNANAILGAMGMSAGSLGEAAAKLGGVTAEAIAGVKAAAQQQFEAGKKQVEEAGAKIDSAKGTIQGNLEQIWYEMGKMEDEEPELEENKQKLLDEAEQLEQDKKAAEQKKEDERKLSSTRAALKNYDGVAALLAENDDLADCAESYSESFFAELNQNSALRLIIAVLEVVGGALGFLCLAPAYEKSKSRFMLLAPAAASLLLAAAALCMALYFGFGMNYAALPVLIFAPIYLLVAAPKNKIPVEATAESTASTAEG